MAGQRTHPPAVAVLPAAEPRPRPRDCRLADPLARDHRHAVARPAATKELADREHRPRRQSHLVAAQVDALRIAGPRRQRDAERPREMTPAELQGAHAGGARQDCRQQVRAAGAVDHRTARPGDQRPGQRVPHPVPAPHPAPVVAVRRRLKARPHGEQVPDSDGPPGRFGFGQLVREEVDDRLIDAFQVAAVDGDPDQDRDDRLRRRLQVGRAACRGPVEVVLLDQLTADRNEQAAQARQAGRPVEDGGPVEGIQRRRVVPARGVRREHPDRAQDGRQNQAAAHPPPRRPDRALHRDILSINGCGCGLM